jgi:pimeloyl-ACP methyl ester carboxylesterase
MRNYILILSVFFFLGCKKENITKSGIVDDHFFLKNKGAIMPVYVGGNIDNNKILIMVHGGPGGNDLSYRNKFIAPVEKEMAVVYWDQRLAGASQGNSPDKDIVNYIEDIKKLIAIIKYRYGSDKKIYMLGHSWGGFLTPYFLEDGNNQNLISGWIQVDGAHNYNLNDSLTWKYLLDYGQTQLNSAKYAKEWKEIVDYCSSVTPGNNNFEVGVKLNSYAGKAQSYIDELSGETCPTCVINNLSSQNFPITANLGNLLTSAKFLKIDRQAYNKQISENLYKIKLPTLLLWGKYDFICPRGLSLDIQSKISSMDITEKIFLKSGHSPMDNEPEIFWKSVIDWVAMH